MADQSLLGLGKIIPEDVVQEKDAIHVAVAPVRAGERLEPGDRINFEPNGTVGLSSAPIGIVDPFLPEAVEEGERFWMYLFPGTITSLRHDWTHPSFTAESKVDREGSEMWLKAFVDRQGLPPYEDLIALATGRELVGRDEHGNYGAAIDGDTFTIYGRDAYGEIPDEFWNHVEIVTGMRFPIRPKYFRCSC